MESNVNNQIHVQKPENQQAEVCQMERKARKKDIQDAQ
jgi:hypothetical protein